MKLLKTIVFTLTCLFFSYISVHAQDDALQREMKIAESILGEIFTAEPQPPIPFLFARSGHVSSEYLPGYGVHLSVGENLSSGSVQVSGSVRIERKNGEEETVESNSTHESVEEKVMEYITGYASTMQSLPENEVLRISYGLKRNFDGSIAVITGLNEYTHSIPKLSFVVKADDLKRHREGRISDDQLLDRVEIQELKEFEDIRDLNIFASVLETSLNSAEAEHLRVNRKPSYEYLPGLGAQFYVTISGRSSFNFSGLFEMAREIDSLDFDDIDIQLDLGNMNSGNGADGSFMFRMPDSTQFKFNMDSLSFHSEEIRNRIAEVRERSEELRKRGEEVRSEIEIQMNQQNSEDLSGDVKLLKNAILEAIQDYGSTLRTLKDDEMLSITIDWRGRNESLPGQTKIRISKQDLMNGNDPIIEDLSRR